MIEVLERHTQNLDRQRLRQLTAMLRVKTEIVLRQLCLCRLAGAAIFSVHRRFHNNSWSAFVRRLRNLEVHIAIGGVYTRFLQEGAGDMEHLKFTPGSRSVGRYESVLRPAQNGVNAHFFRLHAGYCYVFREVPEVNDIGLDGNALAQVLRARLNHAKVAAGAGHESHPKGQS